MFTITKVSDNRLDMEFDGKLDADAMKATLDEFVAKSAGISHGRMFYRITNFQFPTAGAMAVELSRIPELLKVIRQFDRAAILADEGWIRKISEWEGKLIPSFEIKAFRRDQEAEAEAWLNSIEAA